MHIKQSAQSFGRSRNHDPRSDSRHGERKPMQRGSDRSSNKPSRSHYSATDDSDRHDQMGNGSVIYVVTGMDRIRPFLLVNLEKVPYWDRNQGHTLVKEQQPEQDQRHGAITADENDV